MAAEFVEADRATRLTALAFAAVLALRIPLERLTVPDPAARVTDPVLAFKQMTDRCAAIPSARRSFPLTAQYTLATTVQQIPSAVMADLTVRMKHDPLLANPGEPFNRTDVVDPRYPMRRLVLAGLGARSWFLSYEQGGSGYHRCGRSSTTTNSSRATNFERTIRS